MCCKILKLPISNIYDALKSQFCGLAIKGFNPCLTMKRVAYMFVSLASPTLSQTGISKCVHLGGGAGGQDAGLAKSTAPCGASGAADDSCAKTTGEADAVDNVTVLVCPETIFWRK